MPNWNHFVLNNYSSYESLEASKKHLLGVNLKNIFGHYYECFLTWNNYSEHHLGFNLFYVI